MRRILGIPAVGLAVVLGAAAPAGAASSDGAQRYKTSECTVEDDATVCRTLQGTSNSTVTPSGQISSTLIGSFDITVTFTDGYSYTSSGSVKDHTLWKQGEVHEQSAHLYRTDSSPVMGTCTYSEDAVFANGSIRLQNFSFTCTP